MHEHSAFSNSYSWGPNFSSSSCISRSFHILLPFSSSILTQFLLVFLFLFLSIIKEEIASFETAVWQPYTSVYNKAQGEIE